LTAQGNQVADRGTEALHGIRRVSRWRIAATVVATFAMALALAPVASATQSRVPLGFSPIDGSGTGVSSLGGRGIAIDEANGNVFVINETETSNEVDIFGAEGGVPPGVASPYKITNGFDFSFGVGDVAVDNSATSSARGTLYVTDTENNKVKRFTLNPLTESYEAAGEVAPAAGEFALPQAVAVDSHGNVFVGDESSESQIQRGAIFEFSPDGTELAKFVVDATAGTPYSLAVDNADDVFVGGGKGAYKYPANAAGQIELVGTEPKVADRVTQEFRVGIAVDRATNTLFVCDSAGFVEYDATTLVKGAESAAGYFNHGGYIAVDSTTHRIYVPDDPEGGGKILVFGPLVTLPSTVTTEATEIQPRRATLHGTVNPENLAVTECEFEYGKFFQYGETAPCTGSIPTDSNDHAVSAAISGLESNTTYHYRVTAKNANGKNLGGGDKEFKTAGTAVTGTGTPLTSTEAEITGTVFPEGAPIAECFFEYGDAETYGSVVNCAESEAEIGTGSAGVTVHAKVGGLHPASSYHFRLVAKSEVVAQTEAGKDGQFSSRGPLIAEASVNWAEVGPTSAVLTGKVNPNGEETAYQFEFVTKSQFEASGFAAATAVPSPPAPVGAGEAPVSVSQQLSGLSPATAYVARLSATNASNTTLSATLEFSTYLSEPAMAGCPNDAFRTVGPAGGLPDCRAYEQASPVDKNDNNAAGNVGTVEASASGDAVTFISAGYIPGTPGTGNQRTHYIGRRSDGNWSVGSLEPSPSYGHFIRQLGWAPEAGLASVSQAQEEGGVNQQLIYRSPEGSYRMLAPYTYHQTEEELEQGVAANSFSLPGASTDGSKVFIEDSGGVMGHGAVAGKHNVYVWDRETGELKLASVLPDSACGTPPCAPVEGAFAGPYNWFGGFPRTGGVGLASGSQYYVRESHAVSADGEKLFFTAGVTGQLYLREHPAAPGASTVQVSESQGGPSEGEKAAAFMEATPDGSTVFFTSCQKLTPDSTAVSTASSIFCGPAQGTNDLYAYHVGSGTLTDLTPDPSDERGAAVQGMVGASADGSYVYFVANGDLDGSGPATLGDCARSGEFVLGEKCNLYVWHDGQTKLVAVLDAEGEETGTLTGTSDATDWYPLIKGATGTQEKTARVSASGMLLFRSQRQLGSYDNEGIPELYRYRPGDPEPACVSCNPTGAPPVSPALLQSFEMVGLGPAEAPYQTRVLSADGTRVFFETADKLVPADTNGDHGCPVVSDLGGTGRSPACLDVYEWEANGAPGGTCHSSAANGGCLYLISTGTSPTPAYLADASASGRDVFFLSTDQLVPQDGDTLYDVYDASEGGGLASQQTPPPPCEGEGCRGQGTSPPAAAGAATASFAGPGNPKAEAKKKCPKGRTKRKGKCVKPHNKKHEPKKKAHHRRASNKHGGGK
jgi:hypothetical protein